LFAAQGGGAFCEEFSANLALEIVLNEIVEQIGLTTGASGAAVVLVSGDELVCRARSGSLVPPLGAKLADAAGLVGECIRSRRTQQCDDLITESSPGLEAARALGVRSAMVAPLLREEHLVGLLEIFSDRTAAFGLRDKNTLHAFAGKILENLDRAADHAAKHRAKESPAPAAPAQEKPPGEPRQKYEPPRSAQLLQWKLEPEMEAATGRDIAKPKTAEPEATKPEPSDQPDARHTPAWGAFEYATLGLGAVVLACAVVLGTLVEVRMTGMANAKAQTSADRAMRRDAPAAHQPALPDPPPATSQIPDSEAAGGLQVYQNGREVYRLPAEKPAPLLRRQQPQRASSVEKYPVASSGIVLRRVEPEYPEEARRQRIQGAVVLEVTIASDGSVKDVKAVSGPELLRENAISAVKRWKFQPQSPAAGAAERQTSITIHFKLTA
jgi:TonB family protein